MNYKSFLIITNWLLILLPYQSAFDLSMLLNNAINSISCPIHSSRNTSVVSSSDQDVAIRFIGAGSDLWDNKRG